jgi:hypothetical protein
MKNPQTGDRLMGLFLLGVLALSPPLLAVFRAETRVFGIPVLFLYLFGVWAAFILCLALIIRASHRGESPDD